MQITPNVRGGACEECGSWVRPGDGWLRRTGRLPIYEHKTLRCGPCTADLLEKETRGSKR